MGEEWSFDMRRIAHLTSVLLALASAIAAQAAELPTMKAAPSARATKCNVGGMAGVLIPGTNTCVKISGYVSGGVEAGNVK